MCSLRVTESKQSAEASQQYLQHNPEYWSGSELTEGRRDTYSYGYSLSPVSRVSSNLDAYPGYAEYAPRPRQTNEQNAKDSHQAPGCFPGGHKLGNTSFNAVRQTGPPAMASFYSTPIECSSNHRGDIEAGEFPLPGPRQRAAAHEVGASGALGVLKPHSTPATMQWLMENYQQAEGVCIPRHVIYNHYCRFCQINFMSPVNAASFGKIIRQKFNMVKNRRLGTRGFSTYHYHGIGILATSSFYQEQICNSITNGSHLGPSPSPLAQGNRKKRRASKAPSTRSRVLPSDQVSLPSLGEILLPPHFPTEVGNSFFTMYRVHCQRIYDSIFGLNLQEIREFLQHFWNGVPVHLLDILGSNTVINMVGVCDSTLYGSISGVLFPDIHKAGPPRLYEILNKLASNFEDWLNESLVIVPAELRMLKLTLARNFCRGLKCLTSLNKLCNSGHLLQNSEIMTEMLIDFRNIDLSLISSDIVYNKNKSKATEDKQMVMRLFSEFERLMELQVSIHQFLQWLDTVVDRCVVQIASNRSIPIIKVARNFLLVWVGIGTHILRDLTLISANSFGSYHLIGLIFNDYLTHCTEILVARCQTEEMKTNMALNTPTTIHRGFMQEEQRDNVQQLRHQPMISPYKKATGTFSDQHGPSQVFCSIIRVSEFFKLCFLGFLCKQEITAGDTNISELRQGFQELSPLFNLHNKYPTNSVQLTPNAGPYPHENNFIADSMMYANASISPNYENPQLYAVAATSLHGN